MTLDKAKLNKNCIVKSVNITDYKVKLRVMELGLVPDVKIKVKSKSLLKKTLLIVFSASCFTINKEYAKFIEVEYV